MRGFRNEDMKGMIDGIIRTKHISLKSNCWLWKLRVSARANGFAAQERANMHSHAHMDRQSSVELIKALYAYNDNKY